MVTTKVEKKLFMRVSEIFYICYSVQNFLLTHRNDIRERSN